MGHIALWVLAVLLLGGVSVLFCLQAWRAWHEPGFAAGLSLGRSQDPVVNRAHGRGVVAFAGFPLGLFWMMALFPWLRIVPVAVGRVLVLVAGGCLVTSLASVGLNFTIAWFNRPRFLVPPSRREEPGLWAVRRSGRRRPDRMRTRV